MLGLDEPRRSSCRSLIGFSADEACARSSGVSFMVEVKSRSRLRILHQVQHHVPGKAVSRPGVESSGIPSRWLSFSFNDSHEVAASTPGSVSPRHVILLLYLADSLGENSFVNGNDSYTFEPVEPPGAPSLTIFRNSGEIVLNSMLYEYFTRPLNNPLCRVSKCCSTSCKRIRKVDLRHSWFNYSGIL